MHMDHRKAMAVAAAVTATAVAAVVAIGVNFGLFGVAAASGRAGHLSPAATQLETVDTVPPVGEQPPVVETIVVDAPASEGAVPQPLAPFSDPVDEGLGATIGEPPPVSVDAPAPTDPGPAWTAPYEDHSGEVEHPEVTQPPEDPGHELDD
jgi:hypothetical protein